MRYQGRIADWKDDKGFGFVTPNGGGERAFVHINEFTIRGRRPASGDVITYEIGLDKRRRPQAKRVQFGGETVPAQPAEARPAKSSLSYGMAFTGLAAVTALFLFGRLPIFIALGFWTMSVVSVIAYGFDKSAAHRGEQRLSENSFHLISLMGGWPGALIAQQLFRHKTKKLEFRTVFWATVLINIVLVAWLFASDNAAFLRRLMGFA